MVEVTMVVEIMGSSIVDWWLLVVTKVVTRVVGRVLPCVGYRVVTKVVGHVRSGLGSCQP